MTEEWTTIMSMTAILFKELDTYNSARLGRSDSFDNLIADLENAAVSLGREQDIGALEKFIIALIDESKNTELVTELIEEYLPKVTQTNLRKDKRC